MTRSYRGRSLIESAFIIILFELYVVAMSARHSFMLDRAQATDSVSVDGGCDATQ